MTPHKKRRPSANGSRERHVRDEALEAAFALPQLPIHPAAPHAIYAADSTAPDSLANRKIITLCSAIAIKNGVPVKRVELTIFALGIRFRPAGGDRLEITYGELYRLTKELQRPASPSTEITDQPAAESDDFSEEGYL